MVTITIKNVGPIKEAVLDLKKYNILIGQQSTGKSTLAKIACYCSWVEKELYLSWGLGDFKENGYFERNLTEFHKLNGYVTGNSVIKYKSDILTFNFSKNKFSFKWAENKFSYKRRKTLYIPAERSIVSVIPNWFEVNLGPNNTRGFLADWERVRKYFVKDKPLSILNFGTYYYYPADKSDHFVTEEGKDILMSNSSSGLQSIIPLQALIQYYGDFYYSKGLGIEEDAVFSQLKNRKLSGLLLKDLLESLDHIERAEYNKLRNIALESTNPREINEYLGLKIFNDHRSLLDQIKYPQSTAFFIEEPELNLYPVTQYEFIHNLVGLVNKRSHSVLITTHSPYILTSLNNLIYAGEKAKQNPKAVEKIIPKSLWIERSDVSAWKINASTYKLENLLDEDIPMLKAEELDDVSQTINSKFDALFDI